MALRSISLATAVAVAAALFGAAGAAAAQGTPPAAIVLVVDTARIDREAKVLNGIRSQVERLRQSFQAELKGESDQLQAADRELAQQRQVLGQDAFNQKVTDLRRRATAFQEKERTRFSQLDDAFRTSMKQVRDRLDKIVEEIARRRGANMVVQRQELAYFAAALDMTDEVVRRLDSELPSVTVAIKQTPAPAATPRRQ